MSFRYEFDAHLLNSGRLDTAFKVLFHDPSDGYAAFGCATFNEPVLISQQVRCVGQNVPKEVCYGDSGDEQG